jgi:YVTN family beta-propeller protein
VSTHVFQLPGDIVDGSVGVIPDVGRVFAVTHQGSTFSLRVFPLAPTITGVAPASVVADVPTTVTLTGTGLGRVTEAAGGGRAVAATPRSPTEVVVDIPAGVPAGDHPLKVTTPFGSVESTITVAANQGAVLAGTVRSGRTPRAGVELTLAGGTGPARHATTGEDGGYRFESLPYGRDWNLAVHDPAGSGPDLSLPAIELIPNQTKTLDVDLAAPAAGAGAEVARVRLASGAARQVVADPVSGLVFASTGDEVVAIDRDGRVRARIQSQWGAQGLALSGSTLYVNLRPAGAISVIDTTTLNVTGTIPTGMPTSGELAFAAGRLFFTGNDQWVQMVGLDPVTRSTVNVPGNW